jgi:hypothetical protein
MPQEFQRLADEQQSKAEDDRGCQQEAWIQLLQRFGG